MSERKLTAETMKHVKARCDLWMASHFDSSEDHVLLFDLCKEFIPSFIHDLELERAEVERLREALELISSHEGYDKDSYGVFCLVCYGYKESRSKPVGHKTFCSVAIAQAALEGENQPNDSSQD